MAEMAKKLEGMKGERNAARVMAVSLAIMGRTDNEGLRVRAYRLNLLGDYLWKSSDYAKSEAAYSTARSELSALGLMQSTDGVDNAKGMARAMKPRGRYVAGVALTREAIRIAEALRVDAKMQKTLADLYNDLSDLLRNQDQFEAAEQASLKALGLIRGLVESSQAPGEADQKVNYEGIARSIESDYAVLIHRWGVATKDVPRKHAALEMLRQCAARSTERNHYTATILYKLGRVQIDLDLLQEAEDSLEQSYILLNGLQREHARMAKCKEARAILRLRQGRLDDALEDIDDVIALRKDLLFEDDHPDIFEAGTLRSEILQRMDRTDDAARAAQEAASSRQQFRMREEADRQVYGAPR
jgi:tetratricopeptide (TPR) repeat protein